MCPAFGHSFHVLLFRSASLLHFCPSLFALFSHPLPARSSRWKDDWLLVFKTDGRETMMSLVFGFLLPNQATEKSLGIAIAPGLDACGFCHVVNDYAFLSTCFCPARFCVPWVSCFASIPYIPIETP